MGQKDTGIAVLLQLFLYWIAGGYIYLKRAKRGIVTLAILYLLFLPFVTYLVIVLPNNMWPIYLIFIFIIITIWDCHNLAKKTQNVKLENKKSKQEVNVKSNFKKTESIKENKNRPEPLTLEEKKNQNMSIIGLIISAIVVVFMYKLFIIPLCSLFNLSKSWAIGISIFAFFVGFGFWSTLQNTIGFFEKSNKKLSKETNNLDTSGTTPENKIFKLKKLKDAGAITEEEFKEKKKELLDQI